MREKPIQIVTSFLRHKKLWCGYDSRKMTHQFWPLVSVSYQAAGL